MGYFQNLEIELEEIHDNELRRIVAWDRAHKHKLTPTERWRTLTDEALLQRALLLWESAPKPATEHVALQVRRRDLRVKKKPMMAPIGWSLIGVSLLTGVVLLVASI